MIDLSDAPPWLIYAVAITAAATLLTAIYLIARRRSSRGAGVALLFVSILFHAALILGLPMLPQFGGSPMASRVPDSEMPREQADLALTMFETLDLSDAAGPSQESPYDALPLGPLPVEGLTPSIDETTESELDLSNPDSSENDSSLVDSFSDVSVDPGNVEAAGTNDEVLSLNDLAIPMLSDQTADQLDQWLDETEPDQMLVDGNEGSSLDFSEALSSASDDRSEPTAAESKPSADPSESRPSPIATLPASLASANTDQGGTPNSAVETTAAPQTVLGELADDFAARQGAAKRSALESTGGDADTEAAVIAALRFLASNQKADGGWDPAASNAGRERSPLGFRRGGAGGKAETALTGLSLLAMMGSGHTHQSGEHADSVYRGLSRLMTLQRPDGSLAGDASVYAATYCHGMAALALAEAAAMTGDVSAIDAATRAVAYTESMQHPTTGGWRYTKGDPGDLSQLGWQAMVLDAAHRAEIKVQPSSVRGIERFLNSVRGGRGGGLASYRGGELPSRTMTAESMATHLMLGLPMTEEAIAEGERYLLSDLPGRGVDNYYYWYYATIALHQLQDDAWQRWNEALKRRLLTTQRPDGSWPSTTLWGGYGGTVYTTAMATLCLETYYRHVVRQEAKVANSSQLRR